MCCLGRDDDYDDEVPQYSNAWCCQNDISELTPMPTPRKDTSGYLITREVLLWQIEREVASLFKIFDRDGSGMISGAEIERMIAELKRRGFVFGKRKAGVDATEAESPVKSEAAEDDPLLQGTQANTARSTGSDYHPILSKRVKHKILKKYDDDGGGGLSKTEFHEWFLEEVLRRRTNLRVLLQQNRWLDSAIREIFDKCDEDHSGSVTVLELVQPLRDVATGLGEPPPSDHSISRIIDKADTSHDGNLNHQEFKFVIVEVATRLFYSHFNESMNPHTKH